MVKRDDTSTRLSRCPPNRMRDEISQGNRSSSSIVLQGVMLSIETDAHDFSRLLFYLADHLNHSNESPFDGDIPHNI